MGDKEKGVWRLVLAGGYRATEGEMEGPDVMAVEVASIIHPAALPLRSRDAFQELPPALGVISDSLG